MKNFYKYFIVFLALGFLVAQTPVEAKTVAKKPVVKTAVAKKSTSKAVISKSKSKKITTTKKVKKGKVTIQSYTFNHSSFSATEASTKVSAATGKQVPAGYMEALKVAEDKFLSARAKAGGNKAKLDAATQEYDDALAEAQKLLEN